MLCSNPSCATLICLSPKPYRSIDDSPFDRTSVGTTFYSVDVEGNNAIANSSLISPEGVVIGPVRVRQPGDLTDSVDADDGIIDGNGNGGHSLSPSGQLILFPTLPITLRTSFSILMPTRSFANVLGFVWTDGHQASSVVFSNPGTGQRCEFRDLMDGYNGGETAEDTFIGVMWDRPEILILDVIVEVQSFQPLTEYFEFDHVQYGTQVVPEPSYAIALFVAVELLLRTARSGTRFNEMEGASR